MCDISYKRFLLTILILILLAAGRNCFLFGQNVRDLHWLEGQWMQTAMPDTIAAGEVWRVEKSGSLSGFGYETHNNDTIFKEKISIIQTREGVFYKADVAHNPAPVYFILVNSDLNKWVFENPEHDFPNVIAYVRENELAMKCIIEGKGRSRTFSFVRAAK